MHVVCRVAVITVGHEGSEWFNNGHGVTTLAVSPQVWHCHPMRCYRHPHIPHTACRLVSWVTTNIHKWHVALYIMII